MSKITLLLVEDEELIQQLLEDALDDAGFELITAADGAAGVSQLDARSADIAALITDVNLGHSLTGWEVARHARELRPAMPVIYITGDSGGEWAAYGVPDSIVISKPFAPAQVVTAVATLLNKATI